MSAVDKAFSTAQSDLRGLICLRNLEALDHIPDGYAGLSDRALKRWAKTFSEKNGIPMDHLIRLSRAKGLVLAAGGFE